MYKVEFKTDDGQGWRTNNVIHESRELAEAGALLETEAGNLARVTEATENEANAQRIHEAATFLRDFIAFNTPKENKQRDEALEAARKIRYLAALIN